MSEPRTWECRYVPLDYEPQDGEHVTPIPHAPHAFYSKIAVKEVEMIEITEEEIRVAGRTVARIDWKDASASEKGEVLDVCRCLEPDADNDSYRGGYDDGYSEGWSGAIRAAEMDISEQNLPKKHRQTVLNILSDLMG